MEPLKVKKYSKATALFPAHASTKKLPRLSGTGALISYINQMSMSNQKLVLVERQTQSTTV